MNAKILVRVVSWRELNKPVAWIARREGLDARDVRTLLRIAGDPDWMKTEVSLDKYDRMEYLVSQGASLTDIMRTLRVAHATVKRWFPDAGWMAGSQERKDALTMGRKMTQIERKGLL